MKKLVPLLLWLLPGYPIFAQTAEVKFESSTLSLKEKYDDSIDYNVRISATVMKDFHEPIAIKASVKNVTTDEDDFKLLFEDINFPDSTKNDTVYYRDFTIRVYYTDKKVDEVFTLKIESGHDSVTLSQPELNITIKKAGIAAIDPKSLEEVSLENIGVFYLGSVNQNVESFKLKEFSRKDFRKTKREVRKSVRKRSLKQAQKEDIDKLYNTSKVKIENVTLILEKGRIQKVKVQTNEGLFINTYPLSVTNFKREYETKLEYSGTNGNMRNTHIILGSVLSYSDLTSRTTLPSDARIFLDKDKKMDTIKFNKSPVDFFDIRTYTDAKALSGEVNGLIQTEANVRFIGKTYNKHGGHLLWFPYVNMNFAISKFDSDFDTLANLSSFNTREGSDLLKILQYSNITFRVELELFRYSRVQDFHLNLGHQIYSTRMSTPDSSGRIFTPSFYLTPGGSMFSFPRIKCDFKFPVMFNYLQDQPFRDYERKWDVVIAPEIELVVSPVKKEKGETKEGIQLFGRVRYFDTPSYRGGNFWQLQLGVQIPLTEALGLK